MDSCFLYQQFTSVSVLIHFYIPWKQDSYTPYKQDFFKVKIKKKKKNNLKEHAFSSSLFLIMEIGGVLASCLKVCSLV